MNRFCLLTAALGLMSLAAQAQISKGTHLVGGSLGWYNRHEKTISSNNPTLPIAQREAKQEVRSLSLSPRVGRFIADNIAVGVAVNYTSHKRTSPYYEYGYSSAPVQYESTSKYSGFGIAPFLRYYYMPTATFGVFGNLAASYNAGRSKAESTNPNDLASKSRSHSFGASITPTLVFFPIDKLGLELAFGNIGYSRDTFTEDARGNQPERKSISSGFGANFGFDELSLGAAYYFGR